MEVIFRSWTVDYNHNWKLYNGIVKINELVKNKTWLEMIYNILQLGGVQAF